ncbi:hypothetical protein [Tenacibaculum finnmarkense]|uniref:hypothetical protein n=1 Tax=Tenacibaculum finnmarkense TaxID=2781243 RepID=UPI001E45CAD9|nr:hypothetical protein [Tenacibaculum finnmarkense]MCD8411071.1 hypothetical protein [Tenacibaculum finnmarkense genomovar ulcerans]MCD8433629.1 hypothetical protein [Tenacibaculum finnmarkense genomovar ulcerans]MCG8808924.1 hypothetical protein [Tenacibaculum finnmarkense]MCG8819162.1 hypothetical protein [Tenacibaculum finnmarkense]MCG8860071.1 hypothetical protein [Tenacibaculum finnmarkense]
MKYINRLLFVLIFITISCSEKCPDKIELDNFHLSETSKKMFPYQNGEKKLIFKDSINNTIKFELITTSEIYLSETNWNEECILNDSVKKEINIKGKREWQTISFKPDSLINLSFNIFIKQEVEIDASDLGDIKEIDYINIYRANVGQMGIITHLKNSVLDEEPTEKVNVIMINGIKFTNLLKSRWMNSGDIYYDIKKGIVAINENIGDSKNPKFWILDSIIYENKNIKTPNKNIVKTAENNYNKLKKSHELFGKWKIYDSDQNSFPFEIYQKGDEFISVVPWGNYTLKPLVRKGNKFDRKGIVKGEYYIIDSNKEMTLFDETGKNLSIEGYIAKIKYIHNNDKNVESK